MGVIEIALIAFIGVNVALGAASVIAHRRRRG